MAKNRSQSKVKPGIVHVQLADVAYERFSDMSFFQRWIPEGCELVQIGFRHEFGYHDEPDEAYIWIEYKPKEV